MSWVLVRSPTWWHDAVLASQGGTTIGARTAFRRRLRTLGLVELVLLSLLLVPAALAETATATLSVSTSIVDLGEQVTVSGSLSADPGCIADRAITLQWRLADSSGFATVATGVTAQDGSFTFDQAQPHTGRYRATFPETGTCLASTTNEALVRVRALVDAALVAGSTEAGACVEVAASLQPARPGQLVDLQLRGKDGWRTIERLALDPASQALAEPCFTFDDVGVVRLRVRWIAQDNLNETSSSPALGFEVTEPPWMVAIEDAIGTRRVSVAVGEDDALLYQRAATTPRIPASNEKLLLSMTMYDTFGADFRMRTSVAASGAKASGVVRNVWILGQGDPGVTSVTIAALARKVVDAGVTRVRGRVLGSTAYFRRDWDAPGWNDVARDYVNRPTALVFERNERADPERLAAKALTAELRALGVRVDGRPGAGKPPDGLETLGSVASAPLQRLLTKMLRPSDNFIAEMLGKRLGAEARGLPGTIAKGAASIEAWTDGNGTDFTLNDNSGLSYANRVTAEGIVRLLWLAEDRPWGPDLRRALPTGGQGTLRHRLRGIDVRAKTGTLDEASALSGWVKARPGTWVEFSILSFGLSKSTASAIEDRIVVVLQNQLD
jgi:D-alanyl-D-alanine carboxypeptidase/D-alanyl-D-alanine-endopeptidase (penicillin-binding protein 4)